MCYPPNSSLPRFRRSLLLYDSYLSWVGYTFLNNGFVARYHDQSLSAIAYWPVEGLVDVLRVISQHALQHLTCPVSSIDALLTLVFILYVSLQKPFYPTSRSLTITIAELLHLHGTPILKRALRQPARRIPSIDAIFIFILLDPLQTRARSTSRPPCRRCSCAIRSVLTSLGYWDTECAGTETARHTARESVS